jgi:hypothetical protein
MSSRLTRTLCFCSLFVSALPAPAVAQPSTVPRRSVVFFRYAGAEGGGEKRALDTFRAFTRRQLQSVAAPLEIQILDKEGPEGLARDDYQNKAAALELVRGSVFGIGPTYTIANEIYLGDLRGPLPQPQIAIDVPFSIVTVPAAKDTFFAATLFALAMDEQRRKVATAQIINHLAEALNAITNAERRSASASDDLMKLRTAVLTSLETLARRR